jgi:hypothetical protein
VADAVRQLSPGAGADQLLQAPTLQLSTPRVMHAWHPGPLTMHPVSTRSQVAVQQISEHPALP